MVLFSSVLVHRLRKIVKKTTPALDFAEMRTDLASTWVPVCTHSTQLSEDGSVLLRPS
jgi:hypothetical protein